MRISDGRVSMTTAEFVHEHTRLVRVLQHRQIGALRREAEDQGRELERVRSGNGGG
jgi:hypothetical protein